MAETKAFLSLSYSIEYREITGGWVDGWLVGVLWWLCGYNNHHPAMDERRDGRRPGQGGGGTKTGNDAHKQTNQGEDKGTPHCIITNNEVCWSTHRDITASPLNKAEPLFTSSSASSCGHCQLLLLLGQPQQHDHFIVVAALLNYWAK